MSSLSDYVRLTFRPEEDGSGELVVEVSVESFRGKSKAWLSCEQLIEFASRLEVFPLSRDNPPLLQGGFWSQQIQGELAQTHIWLRAYPVGVTGPVGIQVYLKTPNLDTDRADVQAFIQVELMTTYEGLHPFVQQLRQLAQGLIPSAELSGMIH
jgi:hypothetical protein